MDFWATLTVLIRRWYVALPVLALALGLTAWMYAAIPHRYVSTSIVVLTQPVTGPTASSAATEERTNPLLNFRYGLSEAATVVVQVVNTPGVAADLTAGAGPGADVVITNGTTNQESFTSAPFVFVQGFAETPEQADAITERSTARARAELVRLQQRFGADPSTYITFSEVVPPTTAVAPTADEKRPIAAVLAVGVFAMLAATFAVESVLTGRERRRSEAVQEPAPEPIREPAIAEPRLVAAVAPSPRPRQPVAANGAGPHAP